MKKLVKILSDRFNLSNLKISNVVMDSREIIKDSLFFAINNGNKFIDKAIMQGASLIIADNYLGNNEKVIKVDDSIKIMQEIAHEYRKKLGIKVIGITGSNGKTSTKDILSTILSAKYKVVKTKGNYNNHIGVPFTILQSIDDTQILVLEMGMSNFGEIDLLGKIAEPNYAIITNIGTSHLEFLKTKSNVARAKLEIAKYVEPNNLVVFGDDYYLKEVKALHVGEGNNNDFQIKNINLTQEKSIFYLNDEKYSIKLNGLHNIYNASLSIVLAKKFNLSSEDINKSFQDLKITSGRFEKIEKNDIIYINDAYNASPISTKFALQTFDNLYNDRIKIVALGDMLELGTNEVEFHLETLKEAKKIKADKIFLYGLIMKKAIELLDDKDKIEYRETKEDIKKEIEKIKGKKAILLKGSRGMKMEEIISGSKE